MKVLIISHNPISTYQSMGKTMLSLFSSFSKDELCQLYIYPTVPDVDICSSYFRITDRNVLNSLLKFQKVESKIIESTEIDAQKRSFYESEADERLLKRKKSYLTLLLRDIMWKCSRWDNKSLEEWVKEQKPGCIFLAPGESKFIYDIALSLHKKYQLPIITYLCDEFYFVDTPRNMLGRIHHQLLCGKIEKLMKSCSGLITICDELSTAYNHKFHIPATTVYTGSNLPFHHTYPIREALKGISYFGNLAIDRLSSIIDVGDVLDEINLEYHSSFRLFLYTRSLSDEQKEMISKHPAIVYCGYVVGNDFFETMASSDLLLHVESFRKDSIDRVKHSISTKIADSLSSGIPLVAYGPSTIASMNYLVTHECAFCASSKIELKDKLLTALFHIEERKRIVDNSLSVAKTNHDSHENSKHLKNRILEYSESKMYLLSEDRR